MRPTSPVSAHKKPGYILLKIGRRLSHHPMQVCVRWVLQRGAIAALGTGDDPAKVEQYTQENLQVWHFNLTSAEMATLNGLQEGHVVE